MSDLPKLTRKQLAYAHARIAGDDQQTALQEAIPNNRLSPKAKRVEASKLEHHPKIRAYIDAALAEQRTASLLTRDQKRQILGRIAKNPRTKDNTKVMAIKVDNEMTGDATIRFEGEVTLGLVFSALQHATELPSAEEIMQLKDVTPRPAPALAPVESMQTAMERAL